MCQNLIKKYLILMTKLKAKQWQWSTHGNY